MDQSILITIKKLLGLSESNTSFDPDIIFHINTVLNILHQLGVSGADGFFITGKDEVWSEFLSEGTDLDAVISYVYIRVKMLFDPPTGSLKEALKESIEELTWRLNVEAETEALKDG